jgi:hypothetical protein
VAWLLGEGIIGRGNAPGAALFRDQSAPAVADGDEVDALALLFEGAGIAGVHVLARDLAATGVDIDDGALSARVWSGSSCCFRHPSSAVLAFPPTIVRVLEPWQNPEQ